MDEMLHPPKSQTLREMYWRSEILQVAFWLRGEGFGDQIDATLLERFLGVEAGIGEEYLDLLAQEGYLERVGERYALSEAGVREGGLEFAAAWSDLTRPTHGECSADCWCHNSPDEAAACQSERAAAHGQHQH
ncbi:MAG: hypothetical protein M3Q48_01325 [Actinomycetota bacterium]|nr:hypothetical protein [Actinomycetota bacterium]HSH23343.1 hypothetical protein [Acidimicrobiales bacterium]